MPHLQRLGNVQGNPFSNKATSERLNDSVADVR